MDNKTTSISIKKFKIAISNLEFKKLAMYFNLWEQIDSEYQKKVEANQYNQYYVVDINHGISIPWSSEDKHDDNVDISYGGYVEITPNNPASNKRNVVFRGQGYVASRNCIAFCLKNR